MYKIVCAYVFFGAMLFLATSPSWVAPSTPRLASRGVAPCMSVDTDKVYRRAEFWEDERCSLLEIANVLGRWEVSSEFSTRTEFSVVENTRLENMAQGATKKRYEMASRNGLVERVALQQNVPKLKFTNEKLAQAMGKPVSYFQSMPVSREALDVVYDALAQSKASLVAASQVDARRARMITPDGAIDEGAFAAGLYRARALVMFSWLFFGKGQFYGAIVGGKVALDAFGAFEKIPPELAPYADALYWIGALGFAFAGVQSSQAVAEKTGNYTTVTEATANQASEDQTDEKYSTVFEKWAAKRNKKN